MQSIPLVDMYQDVRLNPKFNRLEIGDLLFAEYTCPLEQDLVGIWLDTDYLIHVVSGKKTWRTADGVWTAETGQSLFFKKGAAVVEQSFFEDFCLLIFFVPDELVRESVRDCGRQGAAPTADAGKSAFRIADDTALVAFYQSMLTYFGGSEKPSEALLRLKLRELVLSLLTSARNPALAAYFRAVASADSPDLAGIMEANFRHNLSLEEFARLCHRSLSTFKRDFRRCFDQPPGQWLRHKRLDYGAALLRNTAWPVSQVVFECGFEDLSHFSRAFKSRFGRSPSDFRREKDDSDPKGQIIDLYSKIPR